MNGPVSAAKVAAPWHLWVVGVLALLWNSIGAFDYVMTETRNASYLSSFTPEQRAYLSAPVCIMVRRSFEVIGTLVQR